MTKASFYHDGCPVCLSAEKWIASCLDTTKFEVEEVNLSEHRERIAEAQAYGVKSVPAIVIEGQPFHINFGASIDELKSAPAAEVPAAGKAHDVEEVLEDEMASWEASCCD